MDTLVKVLLVGAGAYVAYELFLAPAATTTATPPTQWTAEGGTAAQWTALTAAQQQSWATSYANALAAAAATPVAATPVTTSTVTTSTGSLANLATAIQAAAANDPNLVSGMMSGDHWNYYANELTGKTLPVGYPTGQLTFGQYWAAQSSIISAMTGLQGLGGILAGLGTLTRRQQRIQAACNKFQTQIAGVGAYIASSNTPPAMLQPGISNDWN